VTAPRFAIIVLLCVTFGLCARGTTLALGTMTVVREVRHDVSPPVRDLRTLLQARGTPREAPPVHKIPLPTGLKPATAPDSVLQPSVTALHAPSIVRLQSFPGLSQWEAVPPDTNGAVGTKQYVQWANDRFAVFEKSTGRLIGGPTDANALWQGFGGPCETNNDGDGIVLFDKGAQRWIIAQFALAQLGTPPDNDLQCVAVSTGSDANGTYNRYAFPYENVYLNDYPKMAVWPDAYYVTFNMINKAGDLIGADACAYDRSAMIDGRDATQVCFQQDSSIAGLLPSDADGIRPPPTGSPNYMLNLGAHWLNLWKFHVDFANTGNSSFTGPNIISVAPFTPLCFNYTCVAQPGTPQVLDPLSDRLMYRLAYRNFGTYESLLVNHSVSANAAGGIRWYEIRNPSGVPVVAQQGTYSPGGAFRWIGSIAMDHQGNIAVGYSESSRTMYPSIAVAGRTKSDPPNTLEQEVVLMRGGGSETAGSGWNNRWGDYSAMQVDPADDCTLWYTQEYFEATSDYLWNTRILSFKFPNCVSAAAQR
jgi:hypothetical protein